MIEQRQSLVLEGSPIFLSIWTREKNPTFDGLWMGRAILTLMNKFCISCLRLLSTSTTIPNRPPTSVATWGQTISNGAPHICTHRVIESNFTFFAIIPDYQQCNIRAWLSKVHGPSLITCFISNSVLNLNWNKFNPASTICHPSFILHDFLNIFWAVLLLKGLHVRNFPIKL